MLTISVSERLAALRKKKQVAQALNYKDLLEDQKRQKIRSAEYKQKLKESNDEDVPDEEALDKLEWSVEQWEAWEVKQRKKNIKGGYRNLSDLAHSTYQKEISKYKVDKEKYKRQRDQEFLFSNRPAGEDIEGVAQALKEASERRQKRRKGDELTGAYITEKNRQFNMKLDREYGKS